MVNVAVSGALGRMGVRILTLASLSKDFKVAGAFEHSKSAGLGKDLGQALGLGKEMGVKIETLSEKSLKNADGLIDFSSPEGIRQSVELCVKAGIPIVIGTTGVKPEDEKYIAEASKKIPVIFSPNMSIGANFLFELARLAAQKLNSGYDIEIVEAHHRLKKDAPSGTAKKIAQVISEAKGWDLKKVARYGREGVTGERGKDELGIHVIRAGEIVGDHTVIFSGAGETVELVHKAHSRDAFAKGALKALQFLVGKKPGTYTMADVLKG